MKDSTKRKEQARKTRNKILDSSLEMMRNYPFSEIKIKDICQNASVTTGAFYHYFSSKDDIIVQLYDRIDQEFTEFYSVLKSKTRRGKIREYVKRHSKFAEKCGLESTRNVYRYQLNLKQDLFGDFSRGFAKHLLELIDDAKNAGEIKDSLDTKQICLDLMNIERGTVYTWCLERGAHSAILDSSIFVDYYLDSIFIEGA